MKGNSRLIFIIVGVVIVLAIGACVCSQCFNPFGRRSTPTQQQEPASVPVQRGTELDQAVMARSVGEKNRPIDVTSSFDTWDEKLYCVVHADRIEEGARMYARWIYEGEPFEDTPEITADREYIDTYVEFHIAPVDFGALETGDYACKIYVNGNPVQTVEFEIR